MLTGRATKSGRWEGKGVQGVIDVFKDADTPEHAGNYRLGACIDRDRD
jgi:hypothetical protein